MNPNIDALEASFDQVAVRGDELVEALYERLFTAVVSGAMLDGASSVASVAYSSVTFERRESQEPHGSRRELP